MLNNAHFDSNTAPDNIPVRVRCGVSEDALTVWAVKVTLSIGGLTAAQKMQDQYAVPVVHNSDDDNQNGITDQNESNDALSLGIGGENELVPVGLDVRPSDVPCGTLSLQLPSGNQFAVCASDDKYGGRLTPSWALDAEPAPRGISLEGLAQCSAQTLTLSYAVGAATLSTDSAKVKCVTPVTDTAGNQASASFVVYSEGGNVGGGTTMQACQAQRSYSSVQRAATTVPVGNGSTVGGLGKIGMRMQLPAYSWIMMRQARLKLVDDQYPDEILKDDIYLSLESSVWYNYDRNTPPDEWTLYYRQLEGGQQGSGLPLYQEAGTIAPLDVCTLVAWDSKTDPHLTMPGLPYPIGANGQHTVQMIARQRMTNDWESISGIPYALEDGPGGPFEANGPTALPMDVGNLVIKHNSIKTNASEDYLKFDPDSDDTKLSQPTMSFTVSDSATGGYQYKYVIFMQPTGASGFDRLDSNATRWIRGDFDFGGQHTTPVTVPWETMKQSAAFREGWGTYTFDVGVFKYDADGREVDWFYYKWPYCLKIGEHHLNYKEKDINFEIKSNLTADYELLDIGNISQPTGVTIVLLDGKMKETEPVEQDPNPNEIGYHIGTSSNGIIMTDNKDEFSYYYDRWRIVIIGDDNCWKPYRRDHMSSRLLAANTKYTKGRVLTDDELGYVLIALIRIRNLMDDPQSASDVNAKNPRNIKYIEDGDGNPTIRRITPIKYILTKKFVESAAKNAYLSLQKKSIDGRRRVTQFIVDESELGGITEFDSDGNWVIIFGRDIFGSPIVLPSMTRYIIHEMLHASHGKTNLRWFKYGDAREINWATRHILSCGVSNIWDTDFIPEDVYYDRVYTNLITNTTIIGITYAAAEEIETPISKRLYNYTLLSKITPIRHFRQVFPSYTEPS